MKATGIVRRIDDLGRVVIPKEIRRTMRIREGDPLEIYTSSEGEVVFKKYSPVGELDQGTTQAAEVISKLTGNAAIVFDRDHVVAVSGARKSEYAERRLSPALEDLIEQGIIKEVVIGKRKSYEYQFNAPELDYERFNTLNEAKKKDLENMIRYVYTKEPRMKYLCSYLGDDTSCDFTNTCDNTGLPKYHVDVTDDDEKDAAPQEFKVDADGVIIEE